MLKEKYVPINSVGAELGVDVGDDDGCPLGWAVGKDDGFDEGCIVGRIVG